MADQSKLFQMLGTKELVNLFNELGTTIQLSILNKAFKKASNLLISKARGNLRGYSRVSNSLTSKMFRNEETMYIGTLINKGGAMAHWVEKGTIEREYITNKGNIHRTGSIKGQKFWSSAVESTKEEVKKIIYKDIEEQINKLVQKRNKL